MSGMTRERSVEQALVFAVAFAFALSFGVSYGIGNQSCYLPLALNWADPTLLVRDWYIEKTTQYHPAFALLGALILRVDRSGWLFAGMHLVLVTVSVAALHAALSHLLERRSALAAYFVVIALAFVTRWRGPAMGYVFDGLLQPSGVSSAMFLLALPSFLSGRYLGSGLFLALSGLFHLNHLALFTIGFGFAHLLLGREDLALRLIRQFGPTTVVVGSFAPFMLRSSGSPAGADLARHVFLHVRNTHHFEIGRQWLDFSPFVALMVLAIGAAWATGRSVSWPAGRRLASLAAGLCIPVWAGIALHNVHPKFDFFFAWRVVPHVELVLGLVVVSVLFRLLSRDAAQPIARGPVLVLAGGAVLLVASYVIGKNRGAVELALALAVMIAAVGWLGRNESARERLPFQPERAVTAACLALVIWFGQGPTRRFPAHSTLLSKPSGEDGVYAWMRQSSPRSALFLTPPELPAPRLLGERAIVVDWKGIPAVPSEILEWYARLLAVTGKRELVAMKDLAGYDAVDPGRLAALRERYGIDYAVLRRGSERAFSGYERAYENASFVVLKATAP